ncbi:MAG: radical SAM protein [Phycisphaerae bacterium]|nr:radical SAM protein [Phycisphaerae bacterium]NIS53759.1 radical SAM protein [Phycisphaerae bacterium]NIU57467.1 radical SAM protein [Phycisphaerae bacterium]NIW95467.1 radical SAM protein [Phycisphaerae bacterium]NIX31171.1 radical SAM protein [Phycisphaerae bacterium]
MLPPIGPIGLDYIAGCTTQAGITTDILDLCLCPEPHKTMEDYFSTHTTQLVGVSFRNVDDCFWPSAAWFVPGLKDTISTIRSMTDAPIVIGGVGYSIFSEPILKYTGADFGIRGDGEKAIVQLIHQLQKGNEFSEVPGLIWQKDGKIYSNWPSWPEPISLSTVRNFIDNRSYFNKGGQCGLETKRGCNRRCIYCADPLAKGTKPRLRDPSEIVEEVQSLLSQGIDVLHFCDSEFNIPRSHALAICEEFNKYSLGKKIRWYTYMSPTPFDPDLARQMARAGCVGIDFTGDSACSAMLKTYQQMHNKDDLASAVRLCRLNNIAVMIDLLLGGPGETPETVRETIDFIKNINPDCAGAALGVRIYPNTAMEKISVREISNGTDSNIHRKYTGPIDLFKPTFYISKALGRHPAQLVRDLIGGDQRFFEPTVETDFRAADNGDTSNYNYNQNLPLIEAIQKGARGAYWDILRQSRKGQ